MNSSDEGGSYQQRKLFDLEKVPDEDSLNESFRNDHQICVELASGSDGFGLLIDGGKDRPLYEKDSGIFITRIKPGSVAEQKGCIEVGDKILEVNGHSLINVNHSEAVQHFKSSGGAVRLVIHKYIGLLLEAASITEIKPDEMDSPTTNPKELEGFSAIGFVVGLAIGCIAVLAIRKYYMQR